MLKLEWFVHDVVRDELVMGIRPAGISPAEDTVVLTIDQSRRLNNDLADALKASDSAQDNSVLDRSQTVLHHYYLQLQHVHTTECAYDEEKQMHCVSFLDRGQVIGRRWYPNMATNGLGLDVAHWVASHIIHRGDTGTISEGRADVCVVVEMPAANNSEPVAIGTAA